MLTPTVLTPRCCLRFVLMQAEQAASGKATPCASPVWHPLDIKTFVGVSGPYDMERLSDHLHRRGLYKDLLAGIMSIDGRPAFNVFSPMEVLKSAAQGVE